MFPFSPPLSCYAACPSPCFTTPFLPKLRGAGADIPGGATLNFDVEVVDITEGPPEPNIFKDLDGDVDGKLSKEEVLAFFKKQGRDELPEGLWEKEDKNEDGVISWEEFSGPKGKTAPPLKDEV